MGNLLYLVIGLIAGIILFAIIRAIFSRRSPEDGENVNDETAAQLAKAEVKIAVLEDKLREESATSDAQRADIEKEYQEK